MQTLRQAVRNACADRHLTEDDLFSKRRRSKRTSGIWFEIAQKFPNRQVESVYKKYFREYQLQSRQTGKWTDEDVARLIGLVARHGHQWALISTLLNRTADSCYDKYREAKPEYKKGRWTAQETETLGQLSRPHLHEPSLPFTVISKKMGNRSRLSCAIKWKTLKERLNEPPLVSSTTAATVTSDNLPANIQLIYESLDRLYLTSDLNSVSSSDIRKSLEAEFGTKFSKETHKVLKARIKQLVLGEIVPKNQAAIVPEKSESSTVAANARKAPPDTSNDSSLTIRDVSNTMMNILKSAPQHRMKRKALRRAIKAQYNLKKSKLVKKFMKKLTKDGSRRQKFKVEGKLVTILGV